MKTLKQYHDEVMLNKNNPSYLATLNLEIAADYAYSSELFATLEVEKAAYFISKKYSQDKPFSDSAREAFWLTGNRRLRI
jgi:hypothetical protein